MLIAAAPLLFLPAASHAGPFKRGDKKSKGSRIIAVPSAPVPIAFTVTTEEVAVTLESRIGRGDLGSWLVDAEFEQDNISFTNLSDGVLTITGVSLVDGQGQLINYGYSVAELEERTASLVGDSAAETPTESGVESAAKAAAGSVVRRQVVRQAASHIPGVGHLVSSFGGFKRGRSKRAQQERAAIDTAFTSRSRTGAVTMIPGGRGSGTWFFPLIQAPAGLFVTYTSATGSGNLTIPLD